MSFRLLASVLLGRKCIINEYVHESAHKTFGLSTISSSRSVRLRSIAQSVSIFFSDFYSRFEQEPLCCRSGEANALFFIQNYHDDWGDFVLICSSLATRLTSRMASLRNSICFLIHCVYYLRVNGQALSDFEAFR